MGTKMVAHRTKTTQKRESAAHADRTWAVRWGEGPLLYDQV